MMMRLIMSCIAALLFAGQANAQSFPTRAITIIVSVAPGGTLDTLARVIASSMSTVMKQTVVVENITGAGGLVGFQRLMKSEPDGYTLMFSNLSMVIIPLLYPEIKDLPSLLKRLKGGGATLNFGSGGPGTTADLAARMFLHYANAKAEIIQYRGTGPALTDLMSGTIDAVLDQTVTMMPLNQDKRIRSIAVSAPERLKEMPEVATFAEGGLPEFNLRIWNGLVAPAGTPRAVVDKLAQALSKAIDSPEFSGRLEQLAAKAPPPAERGPDYFAKLIVDDTRVVTDLSKQIGLMAR
jgi:tripartite-type tricarboxylate transporter receptor subunit TctC